MIMHSVDFSGPWRYYPDLNWVHGPMRLAALEPYDLRFQIDEGPSSSECPISKEKAHPVGRAFFFGAATQI